MDDAATSIRTSLTPGSGIGTCWRPAPGDAVALTTAVIDVMGFILPMVESRILNVTVSRRCPNASVRFDQCIRR
jgi:hypothetical protein